MCILWIGPAQLSGLPEGNNWKIFKEIFYFSTQTFTTVGYGHVYPIGDAANTIRALNL